MMDGLAGVGGPDLAWLAAETGYADQAHLTRECVRLAGLPPAALAAQRRPSAS
jgi:AraC-like DNA-binding protein